MPSLVRTLFPALIWVALLIGHVSPGMGQGQSWPQRPVRFILTLAPGSGTDIGTRLLSEGLSKRWGQPVVVENRPGGDAIVAIHAFLGADTDHVLLASPVSSLTAHPYVLEHVPYKETDLLPIARISSGVIAIAVPATMQARSLGELAQAARAQTNKLNWAGTTGALELVFAGYLKKNGLEMARVPYRNPQDAVKDLATERVQVVIASLPQLAPFLQANKIKLLAVTNPVRSQVHPDVPTAKESGHPELTFDALVGFFGPKAMPLALREKIAADTREVALELDAGQRMAALGLVLNLGGPAEFAASIREQREQLAAVAKVLGLKTAQ